MPATLPSGVRRRRARSAAMVVALAAGLASGLAHANTCTWKTAAATTDFNTAGNWDTCGSTTPQSGDAVVLSSGSVNCVMATDKAITSLAINGTYGGTFNASAASLDVTGSFTMTRATFTAPSSFRRLTVGDTFTISGGAFNAGNGSVVLTATGMKTFATNGAAFYDLVISDGLVGYWKMDDGSGTTPDDSSGYGGHLDTNGAAWTTSNGPSLRFTNPSYLQFNGTVIGPKKGLGQSRYRFSSTESFTLSAWVKPGSTSYAGYKAIAVFGRNDTADWYGIAISSTGADPAGGGQSRFVLTGSVANAFGGPISAGWHHIAVVQNGSTNRRYVYVDGVDTTYATYTAQTSDAVGTFTVGYEIIAAANTNIFDGGIDDVRIYRRVLTGAEISTFASGQVPGGGTAIQNVTGNPDVTNDLIIASGTLAGQDTQISVGGNWWNYGGTFTTGTSGLVTFDGSGTGKSILTGGNAFNNLTISGTGAWAIADTGATIVKVNGTLSQSAGTLTSTAGLLKVAAFNNTGGTFTHNSGTVMLSSPSDKGFSANDATFNHLIINDGLLGYWPLDEGTSTTAADGSGYGYTANLIGAGATWSSSVHTGINFRNPYAVALNGTNGSVSLPHENLPANNAAQTISLWAKITATGGTQNIISLSNNSNSGVQMKIIGTNLGVFMWGGTTMVATAAPSTGVWHHIAYTYNGASGQVLYIDGVATTATVANQSGATTVAYLGTYLPNNEMFAGSLDDVRIYGRALSATEISALSIGNQPGTTIATQSMSGSATVSGDLTIASGGLYLSTHTINLVGDWWNYGGVFWADYWDTATLNLTGTSTTNYIRSAGQVLPKINITGTGKWTLADNLDVDPATSITFTSGSMDILTRTLRVGDLNSGSGTLTASSGTVVLNSNSNQTVNVSGYNVLRIEDASETGLVGYWKMDEGQGSGVRDWTGNGFSGTLAGDSKWTASVPGTSRIEYHDPYAVSFGGTTPYIDIDSPVVATNAAFTACSWVNFNTLTGYQDLASIDGTTLSGFYVEKEDITNKFTFIMRSADVSGGGTSYLARGTTVATTGIWYHVCGVYTGSVARIYVNGTQEGSDVTVSATWVATGHTILGAAKWNGARTSYLNGILDDVRIYNVGLSAAQVKALGAGRYAGTGGATVTLGANVSTTNTFSIDSGGLNTSSYTFGTATGDATKVAYVNGGTLTVGSSTATFNGGLTVRDEGTLSMQTTGGVTALPNGETLIIDGTLDASTAGSTPTIQSVSGSYTFTVGSSATATPVLNINGLAVKNTDIDGMYINTVAGSSTTFTKFDNLAFSNGSTSAGSTFLRIYSDALTLKSGGNTFTFATAKPDYAVKLAGNGTADGETRATFGNTTCPASLCTSSNKSDNDANNDGVGDTPASNAAVVQFVRAIPTDTAGSIEGFPTAAFDWNLFTYYSTYVAFRDYSGSQDRLFVRASSGAASYHWDLPTAAGHIVGTPRWTQLDGVKYVYVGTTNGYVYKLIDSTSSLALPANPSVWETPYCYGGPPCSANNTITTPLGIDGTNVYWVGTESSSNRRFFILTHAKVLTSAALSIPAAVTAAPGAATISSIDYQFVGMQGFLYKIKLSDQSSDSWTQPAATSTINGRVTVLGGLAYLPDNMGNIYAVNASTRVTDWSYPATGHGTCTNGGSCTIKNLWVDYYAATPRVMYGDQDGHIYVITKNGAGATVMSGYPLQPAAGEVISTAPLYQAGIMVVGTASGSLFVINVRTVSGGTPALLYTYKLGSAISSISYNANTNSGVGAYMVGTADGKLVLIDKVSDPDAFL